jgi:ubiquinone/menaquinone biosynthesis C-methylase UbiE
MDQSTHRKQNRRIVDEFTRQALPFSQRPELSNEASFKLMLEMSGVNARDKVLDVACGPGIVACAFAAVAAHVTGIDITPAMIERARQLQHDKGQSNLTWQVGDVLPLPYANDTFSLVVTRFTFHHFVDPQAVLGEMMRVCQPGGRVLVSDPAPAADKQDAYNRIEKLREPSHVRALTSAELLSMAQSVGLTNIKAAYYKLEMELERHLATSCPSSIAADKIRQMFRNDLTVDSFGLGAHLEAGAIRLGYPIMVMVGEKSAQETGKAEDVRKQNGR